MIFRKSYHDQRHSVLKQTQENVKTKTLINQMKVMFYKFISQSSLTHWSRNVRFVKFLILDKIKKINVKLNSLTLNKIKLLKNGQKIFVNVSSTPLVAEAVGLVTGIVLPRLRSRISRFTGKFYMLFFLEFHTIHPFISPCARFWVKKIKPILECLKNVIFISVTWN